jgi:4-azaleucine resistance transporter AzlC
MHGSSDAALKPAGKKRKALAAAFPKTIPIMTGFLFLGASYGILMKTSGFSFLYPLAMSLTIFGGSLEFVAVSMLLGSFAPLQTLIMTLLIQARHLFYGVAMLDKYKGTGWKKLYLIFGMCDESFSINCSTEIPEEVDKGWFMFFVTLLNQTYWVVGATAGGLLGSLVQFDTNGLDFVMTAMFVVIFLENWLKEKKHYTSLIGVCASALCLVILGSDSFMIPTMITILCFLSLLKKPIEKGGAEK